MLQPLLGNQQVQRLAAGGASVELQRKSKPPPTAPTGTSASATGRHSLELHVTSPRGDWIGHAWIVIELPDGTKEGYGFYPKEGAGIWEALGAETEGVIQDDTHRTDTSNSVRYDISEEQYEAVKAYIEAFEGRPYDLYAQNCAHFAKGAVEATGIEPPRTGWLVTWPEGLEQGMESVQKAWAAEAEDLGAPVPEPVPTPTSTPAPQ